MFGEKGFRLLQVFLPVDLHMSLGSHCREKGCSKAAFVRELLTGSLEGKKVGDGKRVG